MREGETRYFVLLNDMNMVIGTQAYVFSACGLKEPPPLSVEVNRHVYQCVDHGMEAGCRFACVSGDIVQIEGDFRAEQALAIEAVREDMYAALESCELTVDDASVFVSLTSPVLRNMMIDITVSDDRVFYYVVGDTPVCLTKEQVVSFLRHVSSRRQTIVRAYKSACEFIQKARTLNDLNRHRNAFKRKLEEANVWNKEQQAGS